jgi:single-strand DNA-binding protein
MAGRNINRVIITGNLTADPELRQLPSGTSLCRLRLATNTRRKGESGDWEDKANFFDVVVWGALGENTARYLSKGSPLAIDGRLEWREWKDREGSIRQTVEIIAENVQFLSGGNGREAGESPAPNVDDDVPF